MYTREMNELFSYFGNSTKQDAYLKNLIRTRREMDLPGFDFDGCDPEQAKKEADELIKKLDNAN